MSYRLEPDEALVDGVRRIVVAEIDAALRSLQDPGDDRDEALHTARKRFKKIRAVLRLVRDEIGEKTYKRENACYRDAGRALSSARDAVMLLETVDALSGRDSGDVDLNTDGGDDVAVVRRALEVHRNEVTGGLLSERNVDVEVAEALRDARERVAGWPLARNDFAAIRPSLKRTYKRGRRARKAAHRSPAVESLHEWRKRVKYLWYHTRLLECVWPNMMTALQETIHELSTILGEDHDLAVLRQFLEDRPEMCATENGRENFRRQIDGRRAELQQSAWPLGVRVYREKPGVFLDRIEAYWTTMR